jgi:phosphoribosylanthranilate isomerase
VLDGEHLPRVKICGLTTPEAVVCAVDAGCEAIGLVEHPPSPRAVPASVAARLVRAMPRRVHAVAVFVDRSPAEAEAYAREAGCDAVQLCGRERARDWRGFSLPILRRVAVDPKAARELEGWRELAVGFVLERPGTAGGAGLSVDWELAARICARERCLLAGGLDAANVAAAVAAVRPAGVDASSRLEREPGVKDPRRVEAFARAALAAFVSLGEEPA